MMRLWSILFVRPNLEYAAAVWLPHLKRYINMLEKAQGRATKLVDSLKNVSAEEQLQRLQLPTNVPETKEWYGGDLQTFSQLWRFNIIRGFQASDT